MSYIRSPDVRRVLTSAVTYYVRTDGSDSNNGLSDTAGGAFRSAQKAVDTIADTLDIASQTVTVQIADGTYTSPIILRNVVGYSAPGNLIIKGNSGASANVVLSTTSADAVLAGGISAVWQIKDVKLQTTTGGNGLNINQGAILQFGNINFGACAGYHILCQQGSFVKAISSYAISGGALAHGQASQRAQIGIFGVNLTITNTPAFSTAFADVRSLGLFVSGSNTFTGSATGSRYSVTQNSLLETFGSGSTYLPGNAAGSTATGGLYS